MNIKETLRIGIIGIVDKYKDCAGCDYPTPSNLSDEDRIKWLIDTALSLDLGCIHIHILPDDPNVLSKIGDMVLSKKIVLEVSAPEEIFSLVGTDSKNARKVVIKGISNAKKINARLIRRGYGKLNLKTSRFNTDISISTHKKNIIKALKEAAKILEDHDMVFAVENHCDFTGEELAEILCEVDSKCVGAAFDTGNAFTVFSDPMKEVKYLAPFTVATHIKDMKIIQNETRDFTGYGRTPFLPVGCALGEGNVDIPAIIDELIENCPNVKDLPLVIELGWVPINFYDDIKKQFITMFNKSINYLKEIIFSN